MKKRITYIQSKVCFDPITIALVASTALGGMSAIQEGKAQAQAARTNAEIAEQNAETTKQQTAAAVDKQDRERRLRMGSARAGAGASGVGAESFGDILQSSAAAEELDLLTLKTEGILKEQDFINEAGIQRTKAKTAKQQGRLKAASSILSGTSTYLDK